MSILETTSVCVCECACVCVCVWVYLEDEVLVAVAKRGAKWVNAVGGRGPVEDHWFVCRPCQVVLHLAPLQQGRGNHVTVM